MSSWSASDPDRMRFGFHVSIAGGMDKAPLRAHDLGCDCFQLFTSSPQSWTGKGHEQDEVERFKKSCSDYAYTEYFCHTIYLINLASPKDDIYLHSRQSLQHCYDVAVDIGATGVVTHIGSSTGTTKEAGIARVVAAIDGLDWQPDKPTMILLENSAGAGNSIGSEIGEIIKIIMACRYPDRIGLCLDTAHLYAAGYDIARSGVIDDILDEIGAGSGVGHLKVIHANDSKYPLGSKKDRHENIGEGYLGEKGLRAVVNHPYLSGLPFILETPGFGEGDEVNLDRIRALVG